MPTFKLPPQAPGFNLVKGSDIMTACGIVHREVFKRFKLRFQTKHCYLPNSKRTMYYTVKEAENFIQQYKEFLESGPITANIEILKKLQKLEDRILQINLRCLKLEQKLESK